LRGTGQGSPIKEKRPGEEVKTKGIRGGRKEIGRERSALPEGTGAWEVRETGLEQTGKATI